FLSFRHALVSIARRLSDHLVHIIGMMTMVADRATDAIRASLMPMCPYTCHTGTMGHVTANSNRYRNGTRLLTAHMLLSLLQVWGASHTRPTNSPGTTPQVSCALGYASWMDCAVGALRRFFHCSSTA